MKLKLLFLLPALLVAANMQAQEGNVVHDPMLAMGADALDPVPPADNAGLQDITVVADGAATKEELLAVPGASVMQQFAAGEGDDRVYFVRRGELGDPAQNVVTFSDAALPTITFSWDLEFDGDASVWSGAPLMPGTPERESMTSGPTVRGDETNPVDADSIWLTSATSGAENGVGFRFVIEYDKPLAAAGFTLVRAELSGRDVATEPETVWEAAFYDASDNLLSRQTAMPGDDADVAALFGYVAAEGETISKVVIGEIEEWFLSGEGTNRIFFDDLLFAVAGGDSGGGMVLLDYDFSTPDRMTMDLPNAAPWYFWQNTNSTATLEVGDGSMDFTIPPADTWNPAGALIPFAEPGGVSLAVGEELVVNAEITLDNVAMSDQGGFRWGVFNYGDGTRPSGDDAEIGDFPGLGVTGYVQSMLFHGNQTTEEYWTAKRTGLESDSLLGSSGNFSWFDMEGNYLTGFDPETQVFFPDEPIHIQLVYSRVAENEVVVLNTILNAEGTILFQSEVSDTGVGEVDPYTTFDSFVFRAQVSGGSATGGVQGDPRGGVEEVISTMHFSQLSADVRDIPTGSGDFPYYLYGPAGSGSLEEVDGELVMNTPSSGGFYVTLSDLPGVEIVPGEKLVLRQTINPGSADGASTNNRFGIFSYADAPGGQPTGDIPDAPGADLPGEGAVGYQWTYPIGQIRQEDPRSGDITINMGIRKRRFGLGDEVTDELQGRSGDYISLPLTTLVEPTKNFTAGEVHTIEYTIELVSAQAAVIGLTLYDSAGEVFGQWAAVDASGDPHTTFDTYALRDGNVFSSGSPLTLLDLELMIDAASSNVYGPYILDETGYIDTGEFMGWIYASDAPWIWNFPLDKWIYGPEEFLTSEGGWFYVPSN